jgi:hypothetical protein
VVLARTETTDPAGFARQPRSLTLRLTSFVGSTAAVGLLQRVAEARWCSGGFQLQREEGVGWRSERGETSAGSERAAGG